MRKANTILISAPKVGSSYKTTKQSIPQASYKSTGNFERMITNYIK